MKNLGKLHEYNKNEYNDWRSDVIQWYNKWVIEGYSTHKKHLYLYGDLEKGNSFIKELIG